MELVRPEVESRTMALAFEAVPAYDFIMSLAAAAQPAKYELLASWARGVRAALPPAQRRDLPYFFGDPAILGTGTMQAIPDLDSGDPAALIRQLESMEPDEFVALLLSQPLRGRGLRSALRRTARKRGTPEDAEAIRETLAALRAPSRIRFAEILAEPQAMQRRYIALLREHHAGWFAAAYGAVAPGLEARARHGRRSIGKLPPKEVIARATRGFTLRSPARSVTLIPSYYTAPFVVVVREGRDVALVYGARPKEESASAPVDAQTVKVLKALADETRLRILQLLVTRPLYGQQIAETLGLSHPTVSHHMALLRIAGLTRTELTEDGNKAYSVRPETVEALCTALLAAFGSVEPREVAVQ